MEQARLREVPTNFGSISELVRAKGREIFTGEMLMLRGVSIRPEGDLHVLVDSEGNKIHCFADNNIGLDETHAPVTAIGTYHGDFFKVYEVK